MAALVTCQDEVPSLQPTSNWVNCMLQKASSPCAGSSSKARNLTFAGVATKLGSHTDLRLCSGRRAHDGQPLIGPCTQSDLLHIKGEINGAIKAGCVCQRSCARIVQLHMAHLHKTCASIRTNCLRP